MVTGSGTLPLSLDSGSARVDVGAGCVLEFHSFGVVVDVTPRGADVEVEVAPVASGCVLPWSRDVLVAVETTGGSAALEESVLCLKRRRNPEGFLSSSLDSVDGFRARVGIVVDCGVGFDMSGLSTGDGAIDDGVLRTSELWRSGGGGRVRTGVGVTAWPDVETRVDWDSGADGRDGKGWVEAIVEGRGCEYLRGDNGLWTVEDDATGKDATR